MHQHHYICFEYININLSIRPNYLIRQVTLHMKKSRQVKYKKFIKDHTAGKWQDCNSNQEDLIPEYRC